MKYRVFDTEADALAAEAEISESLGLPIVGVNALTGEPDPSKTGTERWAVPEQIADGRWVIPSPNEIGVEQSTDWWPQVEM